MDMFIPTAVWRRQRAGSALMRACDLLKTPLAPEQRGAVHQILHESALLFIEAHGSVGPLAEEVAYTRERTPLNDYYEDQHMQKAQELTERLVRTPEDCPEILDSIQK